jgi:hypothetical protein
LLERILIACGGSSSAGCALVTVLEEDRLAPIATLSDVVRQSRNDDAGEAGHAERSARKEQNGNTILEAASREGG